MAQARPTNAQARTFEPQRSKRGVERTEQLVLALRRTHARALNARAVLHRAIHRSTAIDRSTDANAYTHNCMIPPRPTCIQRCAPCSCRPHRICRAHAQPCTASTVRVKRKTARLLPGKPPQAPPRRRRRRRQLGARAYLLPARPKRLATTPPSSGACTPARVSHALAFPLTRSHLPVPAHPFPLSPGPTYPFPLTRSHLPVPTYPFPLTVHACAGKSRARVPRILSAARERVVGWALTPGADLPASQQRHQQRRKRRAAVAARMRGDKLAKSDLGARVHLRRPNWGGFRRGRFPLSADSRLAPVPLSAVPA